MLPNLQFFVTLPPPHLKQCLALFGVAKGWLLLEIGQFVLLLKWNSQNVIKSISFAII